MKKYLTIIITTLLLIGCATNSTRVDPNKVPTNLANQGGLKKSNIDVVMYFAKSNLEQEFISQSGLNTYLGQSMKAAFIDVGSSFTNSTEVIDYPKSEEAGLFGAMDSSWSQKDGRLILEINYRFFDGDYDLVLEGKASHSENHSYYYTDTLYYNIAVRVAQKVFIDINKQLTPSKDIYPSINTINEINVKKLANIENVYHQLSAIPLNEEGYILGPEASLDECLILEAVHNEKRMELVFVEKSDLLNVALFKTNEQLTNYVTFSDLNNSLGDPLVSVSYNFKGAKPAEVMSFSNLSSNSGIQGSFKSHQVSSAIQPASPLAGFYNNDGYLVGFFSNYLNYKWMLEREFIQANTYQFMEVSPVLKFLDKNRIKYYQEFEEKAERSGLSEAKSNLLHINCYQ